MSGTCPSREQLQAFVAKRGARDEMTAIAAHATNCESCRGQAETPPQAVSRAARAIGIALVIAIIGCAAAMWYRQSRVGERNKRLLAAAALLDRSIEARLTGGFAWAPLRRVTRDGAPRTPLSFMSVAAEVFRDGRNNSSANSRHTTAVAFLLSGHPQRASDALEAVPALERSAETWNDLAAVQYESAIRNDEPLLLVRALTSADAALRINPALAEGRFNRALVLERLGLREQARDEWNEYLRIDAGSDWAAEAREHFGRLDARSQFKEVLKGEYPSLMRNPAAARALARQYPLDARVWGETVILGRWAATAREGKHEDAAKHLAIARELGSELVSNGGDPMLKALVTAIDRAGTAEKDHIIEAHLAFRDGQQAYKNNEAARAEPLYVRAADEFERGGSPGVFLARYFAANAAYSLGRIDECGRKLEQLLKITPRQYLAHRAQLLWQIGLVHFARAEWGQCIEAIGESASIFERLDESRYAANMRQTLANAYERMGDPARAWQQNVIALREMGQRPSTQLVAMLTSSAMATAKNQEWAAANSLMTLAMDVSRRVEDRAALVSTLLHRARLYAMTNDAAAARATVADARAALARLDDPGFRDLFEANAARIDASLTHDPAAAAALLTTSIEFHSTRGRRAYLPDLYLERGRAFRRANDSGRAAADFEAGVAALESSRETLTKGEDRWGAFEGADALFDEAIDLALDRGDPATAFQYAERTRARALLDALGATWPLAKPAGVPAGTVVIEYAASANALVIFAMDHTGVRAYKQPFARDRVRAAVTELVDAAMSSERDALKRAGRPLHRMLIAPVEAELARRDQVIFVPDARLGRIPFAALVGPDDRFLIENHDLIVAPSAAVFARSRMRQLAGHPHVLVVSGSSGGSLPAAEREANTVAETYRNAKRLDGATADTFAREAAMANVIHFAGHSVASSAIGRDGYLLLNAEDSSAGKLGLRQIASLRLDRTSVVVLAACSTADGQSRSSEGTISVARAFLAAGVPAVVATLWPIADDDAAAFFPLVHAQMVRGLTPAEAVRRAQLDWLHDGRSPAMWTSVQVIGR